MVPKRIGLVGFDGVVAIDLAGPADVFGTRSLLSATEVEQPLDGYMKLLIHIPTPSTIS
jgi:hypothetical protein